MFPADDNNFNEYRSHIIAETLGKTRNTASLSAKSAFEVIPSVVFEEEEKLKTMEDVRRYIDIKAREYGGRNKYFASAEYKKIYPKVKEIVKQYEQEYGRKAELALKEAGVKAGDEVEYIAHGFGGEEVIKGRVFMKKGVPYVRMDQAQMTKEGYKKEVRWHKGWVKRGEESIGSFKEEKINVEGSSKEEKSKFSFGNLLEETLTRRAEIERIKEEQVNNNEIRGKIISESKIYLLKDLVK